MAKKTKKKLNIFFKILLIINVLFVLLLLLSFSASFINPKDFWPSSFAGILYPHFLFINIAFVILWVFVKLRLTLVSLLPVLIGYSYIGSFVQFNSGISEQGKRDFFKIMSYNVHNFDLYNYKKNWQLSFEKRNEIFSFLEKEQPDILCFQEFVNDRKNNFKTIDTLITFLKAKNAHAEYSVVSRNTNEFGLATFSSFPIVNKGVIKFKNSRTNFCIFTDILKGKDTLRVYNAHFQSLHLSNNDIEFADKIASGTTEGNNDEIKDKSMHILRFMKRAFIKRAAQVEIVATHIKKCPYPVLLCTDLNDTPFSFAYHLFTALLSDAFREAGFGLGSTYSKIYPSFRIDYIFISYNYQAANFKVEKSDYSDHYPISCFVSRKKNNP
jgi:endonuclease/exonuclease/phosphatase family metal-dependent hydrolase